MPSTRYESVKDDQDLRIPIHADQAFEHGISFQAKLIGWQDVPRPTNRTEIVHAMRRIRYEGKLQNIKKKKVTIEISVEGVKVCLKKKKRKKKNSTSLNNEIVLMNHPIYRIFYVSHDSSDLKIFSYIARDGSTDNFTCSVFKSNKKSQAMKIVRTVGQAFEVCHKKSALKNNDDGQHSGVTDEISDRDQCSEIMSEEDDELKKDSIPVTPESYKDSFKDPYKDTFKDPFKDQDKKDLILLKTYEINDLKTSPSSMNSEGRNRDSNSDLSKLSPKESLHLREQLEQQTMQTQQALEQLILVRNQLIAETTARMEAQARVQQLLQQNRELLEHIASVGTYHDTEKQGLPTSMGMVPQSPLPLYLPNDPNDLNSVFLKNFGTPITNNTLSALNQKCNSLGLINQQLTNLNQQLNTYSHQSQQQLQQKPQQMTQQDLFNANQELLNHLQNMAMGGSLPNSPTSLLHNYYPLNFTTMGPNPQSSNQNSPTNMNPNSSLNVLGSASSIRNLTPSPNRSSTYSASPLDENLSYNYDSSENIHFIKPLSQVGTLTTLDSDGKVKVIVPMSKENLTNETPSLRRKEKKVQLPEIVTLKVTDERGNVTTKKMPATPSFIQRSTSEKVPNRSQVMNQVQRTAWARHTTK